MTKTEIDVMWNRALREAIEGGEEFTRYRFAAMVASAEREAEREAVIGLLRGIDETETESADGWWETSTGAAFGAGRIAAIRARGQA